MQEKKFYREEYPLDILEEYGLTEEMIYDLPDFVHETLEMGGKSPLLPIKVQLPYGHAHAFAKFRLTETEEGIDVLFSPKLNSADLSQFSEKEQSLLQDGRVIVAEVNDTIITDEGVEETPRILILTNKGYITYDFAKNIKTIDGIIKNQDFEMPNSAGLCTYSVNAANEITEIYYNNDKHQNSLPHQPHSFLLLPPYSLYSHYQSNHRNL